MSGIGITEEKAEMYSLMVKNLILLGHIEEDDLMLVIKKGTSKMLGEPENKIFKDSATTPK